MRKMLNAKYQMRNTPPFPSATSLRINVRFFTTEAGEATEAKKYGIYRFYWPLLEILTNTDITEPTGSPHSVSALINWGYRFSQVDSSARLRPSAPSRARSAGSRSNLSKCPASDATFDGSK